MQIDFKALELALAPIAEIGQGELTFDLGTTAITLRMLLPKEEVEVQRYAGMALKDDDENDNTAAVRYIDRYRVGALSYAIVQVASMDFRGLAHVETGEMLDNGTPIKVEKHKALRTLMDNWTRTVLTGAFQKFNELVNRTEKEAEDAIEFEPSDIDAEIDRLDIEMERLKKAKADEAEKNKSTFSEQVRSLAAADAADPESQTPTDEGAEAPAVTEPEPTTMQMPEAPRQPITPASAAPPAAPPENPQPQPVRPRQDIPAPDTSFVDTSDEDGMRAATAMEHRRIVEMRRRAAQGQPAPDQHSALQHVPQPGRQPPHLAAQAADGEVSALAKGGELAERVAKAEKVGEIDGKEVFRMPTQALDVPSARGGRPPINPTQKTDESRNPRFRPPKT